MLEIRGIWLRHMSRWDRYVLRPRVRPETSGSETVPHIGPYIVDKGIPEATRMTSPEIVKKNWQLDAKARSIIGAHLNKAQFNRISGLDSAKKMWMRLSKVNEGVSAQRDSRIDTLRSLFNRFKRLYNEHV